MNRSTAMRSIYASARKLDMDDEDRRDVIERVHPGIRSLSELDEHGMIAVASEFQRLTPKPKAKRGLAPRADLRLVHVLWKLLGEAGKLKKPGRAGLNAFIRARFEDSWGAVPIDIDQMREHEKISMVIDALKAWCHREGVEVER